MTWLNRSIVMHFSIDTGPPGFFGVIFIILGVCVVLMALAAILRLGRKAHEVVIEEEEEGKGDESVTR